MHGGRAHTKMRLVHADVRRQVRYVGLFNQLGASKAPLLLLAPCCLPRTSGRPIEVACFESDDQRAARLAAGSWTPLHADTTAEGSEGYGPD